MFESNKLYCGDNLEILKTFEKECIDLIYIDPPFYTNKDYKANAGSFEDKWKNMDEYINWMKQRVLELYRILKPTGSFYLHCDWHASHYLKIMCDDIFGYHNFRNEIIWCYTSGGKSTHAFAKKHDTIYFYSKNDNYIFNIDDVRIPYSPKTLANYKEGLEGSTYTTNITLNKLGKIPEDYWNIAIASKSLIEYLRYPTQKPEELLEKIIKASSNENDIVLDAFCGCGTTLSVAQQLNRKWIGIDKSKEAINITQKRIKKVTLPFI